MPWKTDDQSKIVTDERGNPVWIYEDGEQKGQEAGFSAANALSTIAKLNGEAKDRRLKIEDLAGKLKPFDGIENPEDFIKTAKEALKTVQNLKDKDLIDAGEVEKIKRGIQESMQLKLDQTKKVMGDQLQEQKEANEKLTRDFRKAMIKGAFDRSEFIRDKTVLTSDIAFDSFGRFFDFKEDNNGNLVMFGKHYTSGEEILSLENAGEIAGPEEAISILINQYPGKEKILQGSSASGGGSRQTPGTRKQGMSAEQLAGMPATERLKYAHAQDGK